MRNSSKELSVFNFEGEESNEESKKLSKYKFLQAFTSGKHYLKQPDVIDLPHIDLDEVDSPQKSSSERTVTCTEDKFELDAAVAVACATSYHSHGTICTSGCRSGSPSQGDSLVLGPSGILVASVYEDEDTEPQFSEIHANLMLDDEESCDSLSGASSIRGDLLETEDRTDCSVLENSDFACEEMVEDGKAVIVCPDYVTYGNTLFLESRLTFCSDCISIECSDASGTDEKLIGDCDIDDVVRIACQWSRSVEALLITFWMRVDHRHGVEKLLASITDECWLDKEQKIKSLAERYNDIWYTLPDNGYILVDDVNRMPFSKRFFTGLLEPFEDVIYPKGDPDAVTISKRDVELLQPDTFINDTIIDFYIKYLLDKIQQNEKKRFHFFNSFFFRKLADLDKDPGSISEGSAAFQRVRKWTRKVNIFEKDYIFIPVNFNLHWSLLIICHPGEIPTIKDDNLMKSSKVPCILHMDSIKGSHSGLKNLIQSYLLEEWKGRQTVLPDHISSNFLNLRFVPLELPQQENSSDCGLFLLHYVELFLEEAPICFNPSKITKSSSFLTVDWFPPAEASFKRFHIRWLLYEISLESAQEHDTTCSNGEFPCSDDDVGKAVQFLSTPDNLSKTVHGSTSMPHAEQDHSFENAETLESSRITCACEINQEHDDDRVDPSELLDREINSGTDERLVTTSTDGWNRRPSCGSSPPQLCSTSNSVDDAGTCQTPLISKQEMEGAMDFLPSTSSRHLAISHERDGSRHGKLDEKESPDKCCSEIPAEKIAEPHGDVVADDPVHFSKTLENCGAESKRRPEESFVVEANNGKSEHCHESNPTTTSLQVDNFIHTAIVPGDKCPVINIPERDDGEHDVDDSSKQNPGACRDGLLSENSVMISVKRKGILIKRSESSGSEQVCKRRKVVRFDMGRRVTRSSSKELPS